MFLVFKPWIHNMIQESRCFIINMEVMGWYNAITDKLLPVETIEQELQGILHALKRSGYSTYCLDLHQRNGQSTQHLTEVNPLNLDTDCYIYTYHELLLLQLRCKNKQLENKWRHT